MKTETNPLDPGTDNKTSTDAATRGRRSRRRSQPPTSVGALRFFLSKSDGAGVPALDRELGSEAEAMLESLKTGQSYYTLSEWKSSADLSKKTPLIRKESVVKKFG